MPNFLKDAPAGSEVPSLAVSAWLSVVVVLAGPFGPSVRRIVVARPLEAGALLVAACAVFVALRHAWVRRRGIPVVPFAELARRREAWEAAHPLWSVNFLPLAIGVTVSTAEARAGLPFWLLQAQDWQSGIITGLSVGFSIWVFWVVRRM